MKYNDAEIELYNIMESHNKLDENFTVTFCGVFSSGKSSIINALLNYDDFKLPVGSNPVTKLVTRISYGIKPAFYYFTDGNKNELTKETFKRLITGEEKAPNNCFEMQIELPALLLKKNIIFMDTPGFEDEMGGTLEKISRNAIMQADLVVMCTSALHFGDMFERELIEELDNLVGNYIMVVNWMDELNTKEDVDNIYKRADFLMKGKGGKAASYIGRNTFFTAAAGKYRDLMGFDTDITSVLSDDNVKNTLKKSTSDNKFSARLRSLSENINIEIKSKKEELRELNEKHKEVIRAHDRQLSLQRSELQKKIHAGTDKYTKKLTTEFDNIRYKVNQLEKNHEVKDFSIKVKSIISYALLPISKEIDNEYSVGSYQMISNEIFKLSIPEPVGKRVKVRDFFGQLSKTIEWASLGIYEWDDGYSIKYNNYAEKAMQVVNGEFKSNILTNVKNDIKGYYDKEQDNDDFWTGYEGKISKIEEDIETWGEIKRRLKKEMSVMRKLNEVT